MCNTHLKPHDTPRHRHSWKIPFPYPYPYTRFAMSKPPHPNQQALTELVAVLLQAIESVKATCPDMTKTDAQMLGTGFDF